MARRRIERADRGGWDKINKESIFNVNLCNYKLLLVSHFIFILTISIAAMSCRAFPLLEDPRRDAPLHAMLRELESSVRLRQPEAMARLFSPECQAHCPGLVPFPVEHQPDQQVIRWQPALLPGGLLLSLSQLLYSFRRLDEIWLVPVEPFRRTPQQVLSGLHLRLRGLDAQGLDRVDEGIVDLSLEQRRGRWQVTRFAARPVLMTHLRQAAMVDAKPMVPLPFSGPRPGAASEADPAASRPMALADIDGDGTLDWVAADGRTLWLFRGTDHGFEAAIRMLTMKGSAAIRTLTAADLDSDGRGDLFVGRDAGISQVWLSTPEGPQALPGFGVHGRITAALWGQFDGQGPLDLYVVRHGPTPTHPDQENQLFLGQEARGHVRLLRASGAPDRGPGLAVCGGDLDGDGRTDLVVINEQGPHGLWLSTEGKGVFRYATRSLGFSPGVPSTSCALGDLDGDARLDIVVGGYMAGVHLGSARRRLPSMTTVLRLDKTLQGRQRTMGLGDTLWLNRSSRSSVPTDREPRPGEWPIRLTGRRLIGPRWTQGVMAQDLDLDGDLDLLFLDVQPSASVQTRWWTAVLASQTLGTARGRLPHVPPTLPVCRPLSNLGRFGWISDPLLLGLPPLMPACPVAALPWPRAGDSPGRPSLVLANDSHLSLAGSPSSASEDEHGHGLVLRLRGLPPNRDALGSRVLIQADAGEPLSGTEARRAPRWQVREVGSASGLFGSPPGWVHAGLAQAERIREVRVRWPDGTWQRFLDLPVDRRVELVQGGGAHWQEPMSDDEEAEGAEESVDAGSTGAPSDEGVIVEPHDARQGQSDATLGETPGSHEPLDDSPAPAARDDAADSPDQAFPVADLASLTVRGPAGEGPLKAHLGQPVTLLVMYAEPLPPRLCAELRALRRRGLVLLGLSTVHPASRVCALRPLTLASAASDPTWLRLAPLMPLLALLDASGQTLVVKAVASDLGSLPTHLPPTVKARRTR